jgi:hypothetical protein
MATVIIAIRAFRHRMKAMALPRVVVTPHPLGRPLGAPRDRARQRATILAALDLLEGAKQAGAIVDLPGTYYPFHQ